MTETEIIEYLKQNKEKGVVFDFMPSDVRCWCSEHRDEYIFNFYSTGCGWHDKDKCSIGCNGSCVYCLVEDYEPEPEFKAHWEEFDINEDGKFKIFEDTEKGIIYAHLHWFEWEKFLSHNPKYNNFGGWLYVDSEKKPTWYTSPRIDVDGLDFTYAPIGVESKPATPKKVRFWRCKE